MAYKFEIGDRVTVERKKSTDPKGVVKITLIFDDGVCEVEDNDRRYYVNINQIKLWSSAENNAKVAGLVNPKNSNWIEVSLEDGFAFIKKDEIKAIKKSDYGTHIFVDGKIIISSSDYEAIKSLINE